MRIDRPSHRWCRHASWAGVRAPRHDVARRQKGSSGWPAALYRPVRKFVQPAVMTGDVLQRSSWLRAALTRSVQPAEPSAGRRPLSRRFDNSAHLRRGSRRRGTEISVSNVAGMRLRGTCGAERAIRNPGLPIECRPPNGTSMCEASHWEVRGTCEKHQALEGPWLCGLPS